VYAEGGVHPSEERHLLWVDPAGRETPAQLEAAPWVRPRLSPDEALVALEGANSAVWIHDVLRGTTTRLTLEGEASHAQLSPDGRQVAFLWETGDAPPGIFVQAADGSGSPTRVSTGMHAPSSWSADGRVIAFVSDGDVWTLTLPELRVETVARTPFDEMYPTFSPDGKWLAYTSDESGRNEVFVTAFPTPGAKHKISTEGGHSPAWARTGKELFYLHSNPAAGRYVQDFMAVEVSSSPQFSASRPHKLFQRLASRTLPTRGYDVTADGRFLILTPYDPPLERVTRLQVVLNFFEELKRLAPPR